ncbi:hypothetical protein EES43_00210 [Streptomyces sp. ADI96-02]|uniref:ATP-binding protein n=1 Tax=unclassified Streptomyces TaxID=2593676 RepID=UPI000F557437|nr:ATP-binding protein [Streptomyces sp. ADI96-02]RPK69225.1 hypothetical protein EES43_00210 [Streptomyces sp. ADI96-02]
MNHPPQEPGPRHRRGPHAGPQGPADRLPPGTPPFAAHRIGPTALCLKDARRFTADAVRRWELHPVREDAVQIASELVANAVRHGRRRTPSPDGTPPTVWLALTRRPRSLLCVVYDPGQRRPRLTPPAILAEDHRGLPIVEALSESWGWGPAGTTGKAVWARLPLPLPTR